MTTDTETGRTLTLNTPTLNTQESVPPAHFERHVARLLLVLFYSGQPVSSLLEGQTRQVDSVQRLRQFDFWVREPGHLALALLKSYLSTPEHFDQVPFREALDRMVRDNQADIRRVKLPGATPNVTDDLDYSLSFLTARALVSDRPSFSRSRQHTHQIVLETEGVAFVQKIIANCPTFDWYRAQCELVAAHFQRLERYDLAMMTYLSPELNPAVAATLPLVPFIRQRYEQAFGEPIHVDV